MTRQDILDAGFKEFTFSKIIYPYASKMFQKKYSDKFGIKYHITAIEYDFNDILNYPLEDKIRYEFKDQFILSDNERIEIHSVNWNYNIKQTEEKFEEIWTKLNCQYYERYEN